MNVRHPQCLLLSFSIKDIFYDKMDMRFVYFDKAILLKDGGDESLLQTLNSKIKYFQGKSLGLFNRVYGQKTFKNSEYNLLGIFNS